MKQTMYKAAIAVSSVVLAVTLSGCGESTSAATLPPNWDYYVQHDSDELVDFEEFVGVIEEDLQRIYAIESVSNPHINESSVSQDGNEEENQYYWVKAFYGTLLDMDDALLTVHLEDTVVPYDYRVVNFDGEARTDRY